MTVRVTLTALLLSTPATQGKDAPWSSARQACSQARQASAQTRQCSCIGGMALAFCRTDAASLGAGHQLSLHQHRTRLREA